MSRLVAITWNRQQLLYAVGQTVAGRLTVERAQSVPLEPPAGGVPSLAAQISGHLRQAALPRGEAIVLVGRGDVEMRQLEVPAAPPEELPDMVRFQARNHFTALTDRWLLDFVPLPHSGKSQPVLAAALSPTAVDEITQAVEGAGLKLAHILLRPFAAAKLLAGMPDPDQCRILVEQLGDEFDLTVLAGGQAALVRTVRVPESYESAPAAALMAAEVRRTIAAARNQNRTLEVAEVVVTGPAQDQQELIDKISDDVGIPVVSLDPFQWVDTRPALARQVPAGAGRFAPLLGALRQVAMKDTDGIDFLNPRRRPESHELRRRAILVGAIAAAVLLLVIAGLWWMIARQRSRLETLRAELKELNQINADADGLLGEVSVIDEWQSGDIAWLDELDEISRRFLTPDEAMVNFLDARIAQNKGLITIVGHVASAAAEADLQRDLSERPFHVESKSTTAAPAGSRYALDFRHDLSIDLAARPIEELVPKQPPPTAAPAPESDQAPTDPAPAADEAPSPIDDTPDAPADSEATDDNADSSDEPADDDSPAPRESDTPGDSDGDGDETGKRDSDEPDGSPNGDADKDDNS